MARPALLSVPLALAIAVSSASARADVVPPEVDACSGKSAGAACTVPGTSTGGTCTATKCTKLDYSGWDKDASSSPPTIEYDCVQCAAGGGATDAGGTTPAKSEGGCAFGVVGSAGPFAIAALPGLVLALVRRRRGGR